MKAYALRDSESGLYLPWGNNLRHNSHAEFVSVDNPRLFNTKRAVTNARTAWLSGKWRGVTVQHGEFGEDVDYYPAPFYMEERRDRKIEVVEFSLTEVRNA